MRTVLNHFGNSARRADTTLGEKNVVCALRAHRLSGISALFFAGVALAGCSPKQEAVKALQDKPLAAYQNELINLAFETATMIPVNPHIKDRSKTQAAVATVCFELDQPQRALGYIEKIGDWRRGLGYADYAFYCAKHGCTNELPRYLDLAEQISAIADQDWRRDRIKVRIAQTHLLLGQTNQSARFTASLENSESGKAEQVKATLCKEDDFDDQMNVVDKLVAIGDFELVKNALYAGVRLFDCFYDDTERCPKIEEKIKTSWNSLPIFVRIEILMEMAKTALQHTDQPKALELVNDAKTIMDSFDWPAEYHIPMAARLAAIRYRAGDVATAQTDLKTEQQLFNDKQSEIINIDKADTLIPVAEAFQTMSDTAGALAAYKQAVEAAVENPNSRPRAEDLSAICLSMAKYTVEPDTALWLRIREIKGALGEPW